MESSPSLLFGRGVRPLKMGFRIPKRGAELNKLRGTLWESFIPSLGVCFSRGSQRGKRR